VEFWRRRDERHKTEDSSKYPRKKKRHQKKEGLNGGVPFIVRRWQSRLDALDNVTEKILWGGNWSLESGLEKGPVFRFPLFLIRQITRDRKK